MLGFAILHGPWNRMSLLSPPSSTRTGLQLVWHFAFGAISSESDAMWAGPRVRSACLFPHATLGLPKQLTLPNRPQTHSLSRTAPLLPLLLWLPRPHPLLCDRRPVVHRYRRSSHHPGRGARFVFRGVLPWGDHDVAVWGPDDVAGRGEYIAYMMEGWCDVSGCGSQHVDGCEVCGAAEVKPWLQWVRLLVGAESHCT